MKNRLDTVSHFLTNQTVLADWFSPLSEILDNQRFNKGLFNTLSMDMFLLLGCLRQLHSQETLREQVQSIFHIDDNTDLLPLARSTWSDALASPKRCDITREALARLVSVGCSALPDRLGRRPGK